MVEKLSAIGLTSKLKANIAVWAIVVVVIMGLLVVPDMIPEAYRDQLWGGLIAVLLAGLGSAANSYRVPEKKENFEETKRL